MILLSREECEEGLILFLQITPEVGNPCMANKNKESKSNQTAQDGGVGYTDLILDNFIDNSLIDPSFL